MIGQYVVKLLPAAIGGFVAGVVIFFHTARPRTKLQKARDGGLMSVLSLGGLFWSVMLGLSGPLASAITILGVAVGGLGMDPALKLLMKGRLD